jgi:adenosylcobinamide kinase/adenosylcobinamide-phosphate guanylyltransferase
MVKAEKILVLGGARSGKSAFALALAGKKWRRPLYVATAEYSDPEMARRIAVHKKSRSRKWACVEEPLEIARLISGVNKHFSQCDGLLIDCLTVWLNNVIYKEGVKSFQRRKKELLQAVRKSRRSLIMVANEVGLGVVPPSELGREFRDLAGRLNQDLASIADTVVFMAAGLPLVIKGRRQNAEGRM